MKESQQIFKPKCRLNILFLKLWANDLISIFKNTIKTNSNDPNKNIVQ